MIASNLLTSSIAALLRDEPYRRAVTKRASWICVPALLSRKQDVSKLGQTWREQSSATDLT
jgi:hypothetical protein